MRARARVAALALIAVLTITGCMPFPDDPEPNTNSIAFNGGGGTSWDPGNIFSDAVFYNSGALANEAEIQAALDKVGESCQASSCLRNALYQVEGLGTQWCRAVPSEAAPRKYAYILYLLAQACGFNPQVAIAMIQKESQGLTKTTPPNALTGWGCPDSGPGGTANCDPSKGGVWSQTAGMFSAFAAMRQDDNRVARYIEGATHDILWNVIETGCGAAPVTVLNRATASLYTYTPYQPNAAALAAYPGTGDQCSAYGNRNVFFLFQEYFGSTGGGRAVAPGGGGGGGGVQRNSSQDPSTFGWQHNGPMEPLNFQGTNFGSVAAGTGPLWQGLLTDIVPHIPGGLNNYQGCYADRQNVNSPGRLSFHAYGLACDINFNANPNGSDPAFLTGPHVIPISVAQQAAAKWGMEWGGDWDYPDPMHFEIHISPEQVRQITGVSTV